MQPRTSWSRWGILAPMSAGNIQGPSKSWGTIGRTHAEILAQPDGWDTFRRTIATRYFTDPEYSEEDIEIAARVLQERGIPLRETDTLEGGPVYIQRGAQIITQDLLVSASELHTIETAIDFSTIKSIVEIGGGYGRMPLLMLQRYPHLSYTIIDVPPAINVSRRFLKEFDVQYKEPSELGSITAADLFYSSSVMSELDFDIVRSYFDAIGRTGRYFYLKDWKRGHHMNSLPIIATLLPRIANKFYALAAGQDASFMRRIFDAYRIHEDTYARFHPGWKELVHRDCDDRLAFSPTKARPKFRGEGGFFEILYQIR